MKVIRLLDTDLVKSYVEKFSVVGDLFTADNILKEVSLNLGALVYIDKNFLEANLSRCLELSNQVNFHVITEHDKKSIILGQSGYESEDVFVRSVYAEQAAITYVHEMNNHLAIICGRLYEIKKMGKIFEGDIGEKFETKLKSMNEKVNKITGISRLFTRKSIKAVAPTSEGESSIKDIVDYVLRDYRKVLEKSKNTVINEVSEDIMSTAKRGRELENILITIILKLAHCSQIEEAASQTTIQCLKVDDFLKFNFTLEGKLGDLIQESIIHRCWMSLLSSANDKKCKIDISEESDKINIELTFENLLG